LFDFNQHKNVDIFRDGHPDGLVNDLDGNLWVVCAKGGALIKIDATTGKYEYVLSVCPCMKLRTT
jgi:sugar lactone lactonase YvrE